MQRCCIFRKAIMCQVEGFHSQPWPKKNHGPNTTVGQTQATTMVQTQPWAKHKPQPWSKHKPQPWSKHNHGANTSHNHGPNTSHNHGPNTSHNHGPNTSHNHGEESLDTRHNNYCEHCSISKMSPKSSLTYSRGSKFLSFFFRTKLFQMEVTFIAYSLEAIQLEPTLILLATFECTKPMYICSTSKIVK